MESVRVVVIECPTSVSHNILEVSSRKDIILREGVRSDIASRFALARNCPHPYQLVVVAAAIGVILHILPNTVGNLLQLELRLVGIEDCIELDTRTLNPPEVVVVGTPDNLVVELLLWICGLWSRIVEILICEVVSPIGSLERMVLLGESQLQEDRVTHGVVCSFLACYIRLVVLALGLHATTILRTRKAENTIARAVQEQLSRNGVFGVVVAVPALYGCNLLATHHNIAYRGVEQKTNVRLLNHGRVDNIVPQRVALQWVVEEVATLHLLDDTRLLTLVLTDTDDTHTHLARCVTSEHWAILDKDNLRAVTSSRNSCTYARQTTTADNNRCIHLDMAYHLVVLVGLECCALLLAGKLHARNLRGCISRKHNGCYNRRSNSKEFFHRF